MIESICHGVAIYENRQESAIFFLEIDDKTQLVRVFRDLAEDTNIMKDFILFENIEEAALDLGVDALLAICNQPTVNEIHVEPALEVMVDEFCGINGAVAPDVRAVDQNVTTIDMDAGFFEALLFNTFESPDINLLDEG